MILIFGGTTEGKKVTEVLDFIEEPYYYSTKTKVEKVWKGKTISGGMDADEIIHFCQTNSVHVLIDAAHPFATALHQNIYTASRHLRIPIVRYERTFPKTQESENLRFFDSLEQLAEAALNSKFEQILALTGVQTIPALKKLWKSKSCYFRILNSDLSQKKANESGISGQFIIPMDPSGDIQELIQLVKRLNVELLLTKESGESGFMQEKLEAANRLNIPLWIVKRPTLPPFDFIVHAQKELLQQIYLLRKSVLKSEGILRSGYTTGSCVTAAAKACFLALINGKFQKSVEIQLPDGEKTNFLIFPESLSTNQASCTVIKNGGDDPDVTHGKEIGCELQVTKQEGISFLQGKGVGKVTLPGLSLAVGEPAINPIPRQMITNMLEELRIDYETETGFRVKPFVPEGEKLASQTFNPRIGVLGGISIIGTTGRVKPFSNEAFLATIEYQLSVANESGTNEIVLTSGKRSENIMKPHCKHLPDTAFIHFGNLIGDTVKLAAKHSFQQINLGVMLGKAIKLAEGHLNTHNKQSAFNPKFTMQLAKECGYHSTIIQKIGQQKLANAIRDIIPFSPDELFYLEVAQRCARFIKKIIGGKQSLKFSLIIEDEILLSIKE